MTQQEITAWQNFRQAMVNWCKDNAVLIANLVPGPGSNPPTPPLPPPGV